MLERIVSRFRSKESDSGLPKKVDCLVEEYKARRVKCDRRCPNFEIALNVQISEANFSPSKSQMQLCHEEQEQENRELAREW